MSDKMPHNATPDDDLTPVQQAVVAALLAGKTVTAAAKAAEVDRTTVYRWLRDPYRPAFRAAYSAEDRKCARPWRRAFSPWRIRQRIASKRL